MFLMPKGIGNREGVKKSLHKTQYKNSNLVYFKYYTNNKTIFIAVHV